MVKLVSFILLGFAVCMVAALPSIEDSNGYFRVKRHSISNPEIGPISSVQVAHGDHVDQIDINSDGSVTKTHNHNHPNYNNYNQGYGFNGGVNPGLNRGINPSLTGGINLGFNSGINPGFNAGVNPGYTGGVNRYNPTNLPNVDYLGHPNHNHQHNHFPGEASIEVTEFSQDGFGHDVVKQTQVYRDGHTHSQTRHL